MPPTISTSSSAVTISSLFPDYAAALAAMGHRPRGRARYLGQLRRLDAFLESLPVSAISAAHCHRAQEDLATRCAPATLQVSLSAMRSFFGWCVVEQIRSDNPALSLSWPRRGSPQRRILDVSTLETLRARLKEQPLNHTELQHWRWARNRRAVLLMLHAGLRLGEVAALRWGDILLDDRRLIIQDGKGGKGRVIPINETLYGELAQVTHRKSDDAVVPASSGAPFAQPGCLAHVFTYWMQRELQLTITAHQLRHAFATSLYRKGAGVRVIQELLGHSSLETTMWYLGIASDEALRAVRLLD